MRKYRLIIKTAHNLSGLDISKGYIMEEGVWVEYTSDKIIMAIIEEASCFEPAFNEYFGSYLRGEYGGVSLCVLYYSDDVPDKIVDRVENWLWENTQCEYDREILHRKFFWHSEWTRRNYKTYIKKVNTHV
jgi:hypothetical protein